MLDKIQHLLNLDKQRVILLGGIPGSGKSTIAQEFEKAGYIIVCPDTYRRDISKTIPGREHWTDAMHEGDQHASKDAWDMAHKDSVEHLKAGKSIVFDAMLHTEKARRRLFAQLDRAKAPYYSVYVDVTLDTAIERNIKREERGGRGVPEFIIKEKWKVQAFPSKVEGFDETIVLSELRENNFDSQNRSEQLSEMIVENPRKTIETLRQEGLLNLYFPSLDKAWGLSQDNQHHSMLLHNHMITAAELIKNRDPISVITALLHDVGKVDTKEFYVKVTKEGKCKVGEKLVILKTNEYGVIGQTVNTSSIRQVFLPSDEYELDPNAHFYNHENVGAVAARRDLLSIGFDEDFANEVYFRILYHMELPFKEATDKQLKKIIEKVGIDRIHHLLALRKADKLAGSAKDNFLEVHEKMVEQVNQIIKREEDRLAKINYYKRN